MIKILFYTDTPLYGGAEKQLLLLAKNLNRKKFEPIIVCGGYESLDNFVKEATEAKLELIRINAKNKHSLKNYYEFIKILKDKKPDLVHAHVWNPMACKYAIIAARKFKIPILITEHDPFPLNGIKKIIKKFLLSKVNHIITVSKANENFIKKTYPESKNKITTIYNGIDLTKIENELKNYSPIERIKIKKNLFHSTNPAEKIIISIGTLHPRKGFIYLLEAFQKVHKKNPLTKLVIVGEGRQRPILEELIKNLQLSESCLLLGWQENTVKLMAASDIFVLPSIKEAFGLAIVEALAAKLPVIATQVGGIPEIIRENEGILVPTQNSEKLAEAILELLKNATLYKKLTRLGHERSQNFNAKKNAEETEKIYAKFTKN